MTALVARDGDALHVFLNGGIDNFLHRAVVSQMNNLRTRRLQNASHDVNRRIVTVEKRSGGDEANFIFGLIWLDFLHDLIWLYLIL